MGLRSSALRDVGRTATFRWFVVFKSASLTIANGRRRLEYTFELHVIALISTFRS